MLLQDYLSRVGQELGSHSSLLIITANIDPIWTAHLLPLMWRGVMPTVFLLDSHSYGGSADTKPITDALQRISVPCHMIPKAMLNKKQIQPGQEGEWEWRISGTGKAVPVRIPQDDWRRLE
jgi:hypothetical protein